MGLFDTTANEVAVERLTEARKGIKSLQDWLNNMDEAIKRNIERGDGQGFPVDWCSEMMNRTLIIHNEVARCNGAVLVRGTKKEKS